MPVTMISNFTRQEYTTTNNTIMDRLTPWVNWTAAYWQLEKMKLALFVTLIAVIVAVNATSEDVDEAWNDFKFEYRKQYRSMYQETIRKAIFTDNYNAIVEHNKLHAKGIVKYSLAVNEFTDMTNEEVRNTLNGYKKNSLSVPIIDVETFVPDPNVPIPDTFDWREKGAVTEVKNQGQCGSCWTFSSTGSLEGQYFLKTGKLASFSEQNLVDCSLEYHNMGCNGGDMNAAFMYIHNNDGIDSEESYPYEAKNRLCRYQLSANVTSAKGYGTIEHGNEEHLKAAIATIGPIAVAIDASQREFQSYKSGIYYNPRCSSGSIDPENELDHAVLAIGYGSEGGEDYWLIKNSWGTSWGDDGFIKMARNRDNNCGVAAVASYPIVY